MSVGDAAQGPVRIAVLGGDCTGKTSLISRLTVNLVHEAHYPTRAQTNWLFDFVPRSKLAQLLLDTHPHGRLVRRLQSSEPLEPIFNSPVASPSVLLSPLVFQAFMDEFAAVKHQNKTRSTNHFKSIVYNKRQPAVLTHSTIHSADDCAIPDNYVPPQDCPSIPIDIIDTPGFKPEMVVPFLEVSLFRNLGKNILKGLANEPRRPVSTTSLLVASGASELNGKIDGYIFVYSAVPELNHASSPPDYNDNSSEPVIPAKKDGGLSILESMRHSMKDAWTEYRNYQNRWDKGKETDVYSLGYSLKNILKTDKERNVKLEQLRSFNQKLESLSWEPSSPDSPPPILIVCSHANTYLASPLLIDAGKKLATKWKCGFVSVDSMENFNVDVALSLLIREIAEKERIQSRASSHSNNVAGTHVFKTFVKA